MIGVEEEVDASRDEEAGKRDGRLVRSTCRDRSSSPDLADDWRF